MLSYAGHGLCVDCVSIDGEGKTGAFVPVVTILPEPPHASADHGRVAANIPRCLPPKRPWPNPQHRENI